MNLSPRTKVTAGFAGAFLLGVLGTAVLLPRRQAAPPPPPTPQANKDAPSPISDMVTLDAPAARKAGVQVQAARYASVQATLAAPGVVETSPSRVAKITPPVAGKVTRILVTLGQNVSAGQPLVVLDSTEVAQAQAAVQQAQADQRQAEAKVQTALAQVRQAQGNAASARAALNRQREFVRVGAFSQAPLQAAQSEQSQAQSELLQAQSELQTRTGALARAQKLFEAGIDSRAELEQAQADQRQSQIRVGQGQARVGIARLALTREQTVSSRGLLNQQPVQTAQAELRTATGEVQRLQTEAQAARTGLVGARQAVAAARTNLAALVGSARAEAGGRLTLRAPISGTVAQRPVTLGEAVERSGTLLTLQNLASVTVTASVGEADVARVRVGQPVEVMVSAYPGRRFPGVVQSLGDALDSKTRTLPAHCLVENRDGSLKPAMFARVSLATGRSGSAVTVPSTAIDEDGTQRFVYVAKVGGYERRPVRVGRRTGATTQIVSGLRPGERVAVAGVFVLKSESKKSLLAGDKD